MKVKLDPRSLRDYRLFLQIKALPKYRFGSRYAEFPDEYAERLGLDATIPQDIPYEPSPFLFDYQAAIAKIAIHKRKFALFADCGLGKTLIYGEFARHVDKAIAPDKAILFISPLMVVDQTVAEFNRWYGDSLPIEKVSSANLPAWLESGGRYGITNFEALNDDLPASRLGALIVDESSMLKSHYGKWGRVILNIGSGLTWKLAGTGTPAPNDRIEYANHAVLMDAFPNVNSFLARYFVNRGQQKERWVLKPHSTGPFYHSLSHWCIFLNNPGTYGWKDHSEDIPPIKVHIHHVDLTADQAAAIQKETGQLLATSSGGIGQRGKLGQIAKGRHNGRDIPTNKPAYIRKLIDSWPDESTLVWCIYNAEQEKVRAALPGAANITGQTPYAERMSIVERFKSGQVKVLITKPKILGYGLNLQIATRHVFSGLQDSYEQFYQAVKRSNRIGSTRPLNVHIPVTQPEIPMVENVLSKAHRIQQDTEEQERIFKSHASQYE